MTPREKNIREFVLEWVDKAEDDYVSADRLLSHESPRLGPIGFLAQQCAEKYLKAFLAAYRIEFPKTHDIDELLALVGAADAALAESLVDAETLTGYAVDIRYPDETPEVSPALVKEAVELASKVRDAVREALRGFLGEDLPGAQEGG